MVGQRLGFAAFAVIVSWSAASAHSGSLEDQLACTPDVYRLCASQIPNEDAIVACLTRNKAALSAGCGRVFGRQDQGSNGQNSDDN